ncbi:MAG TPA: hypothetical protein VF690_01680 [Hymenobacter sp.]
MPSLIILADNPTADFLAHLNTFGFGSTIPSTSPVYDNPIAEQEYWRTVAKLPENVLYHPSLKASESSDLVQHEASDFYEQKIQVIGVDLSLADCHVRWVGSKQFDRVDSNAKSLAEIQLR